MADTKKIVQLQDENNNPIYPTTTLEAIAGSNTLRDNFVQKIGDTMSGPLQATGFIGPLTGNATSADKLNTDKGDASNPVYFLNGIPVACTGTTVPTGGSVGQVLIKDSSGNTVWQELVALPKGGTAGQLLVKSSATDGDADWVTTTVSNSWTAGTTVGPTIKTTVNGVTGTAVAIPSASGSASGIVTTDTQTFGGNKTFAGGVQVNGSFTTKGEFEIYGSSPHIDFHFDNSTEDYTSRIIETSAGVLESTALFYGAVWNDYAEYRNQKEIIEPGYCVASADNGQVYKTIEKFQACDGIVSDTFGFAIGKTDECKTPLAVAGRVLAYYSGNREDYHAGDTVCAGPEGKVIKMTREEIREWPDRIVGIVSEIPEYETWGSGNIKVNNRIWIKVK